MTHGQHAKTSQLLWCVKHNRRETTGHLRIQTNLDTSLDLGKKNGRVLVKHEIDTHATTISDRTTLFSKLLTWESGRAKGSTGKNYIQVIQMIKKIIL